MSPTCRFLLVDFFLIKAGRGQFILETGNKLTPNLPHWVGCRIFNGGMNAILRKWYESITSWHLLIMFSFSHTTCSLIFVNWTYESMQQDRTWQSLFTHKLLLSLKSTMFFFLLKQHIADFIPKVCRETDSLYSQFSWNVLAHKARDI